MATPGSIIVDTRQVLVNSEKLSPYMGIHNDITGFNWDERTWPTEDEEKSTAYLPVLWDPSRGGINYDEFQSGIGHGNDLKYKEVKLHRQNNSYAWKPLIHHGYYYRHFNERYLYGSEAVNDKLTESENINGNTVNVYNHELELKSFIPSSANIYKRGDAEGIPIIDIQIRQRTRFSGTIESGEQLETVDSNGNIVWANVDTNKDEFTIDRENDKFIFNKIFIERVGVSEATPTLADVLSCELLGESPGKKDLILTTRYFPIVADSAKIYVLDKTDNSFEEWTIVPDISQVAPGAKSVQFDYDTGVAIFGDDVNNGAIPNILTAAYITYEKTARIEYEPAFSTDYKEADLDVNPLRLGINRGFVFLSEADNFLSRIVVTVDKPLIGSNLYGPLYNGGDYAIVSATAYNLSGQPLPNAEITFSLDSGGYGFVNGQQDPVTAITDFKGNSYVTVNTSSKLDAVSATSSTLVNGDTELVLDRSVEGLVAPEDVYLYQLKDDDSTLQEGDYRKVVVYTHDSAAINPNRYQDWLEAGSPREAITDVNHQYYFKTGGNVPLRPTSVEGNKVKYAVPLDPIGGSVVGYLVTVGRSIRVDVSGINDLHKSVVHGNNINMKVQLPTYLTGAFVDSMNNYVYYGFRFADEHTHAASSIGTATFLTINPEESSQIRNAFDVNI